MGDLNSFRTYLWLHLTLEPNLTEGEIPLYYCVARGTEECKEKDVGLKAGCHGCESCIWISAMLSINGVMLDKLLKLSWPQGFHYK